MKMQYINASSRNNNANIAKSLCHVVNYQY